MTQVLDFIQRLIFVTEIHSGIRLSIPHNPQQKPVEFACSMKLISVDCMLLFNIPLLLLLRAITASLCYAIPTRSVLQFFEHDAESYLTSITASAVLVFEEL